MQADSSWRLSDDQEGISAFETLRSLRGRIFALDAHLARLERSCALLGLPAPEVGDLASRLQQIACSCLSPCVIRVRIGPDGEWVHQGPLNEARLGRPITLGSAPLGLPDLRIAEAKHTRRSSWRTQAQALGVDELLWTRDGLMLETHQGNVFAEVEGRLVTPPLDGSILAGVTRQTILRAGQAAGLPIVEDTLPATHRGPLWVSSTLKGLAPVSSLDGHALPQGELGEVAAQVYAAQLDLLIQR